MRVLDFIFWRIHVRAYLATINGSLQIAKAKIQSLQRQGDQYIMDVVLASRLFKPWEIKFINYSWLYLQVLSLSDMYNAQGNAMAWGFPTGTNQLLRVVLSCWNHCKNDQAKWHGLCGDGFYALLQQTDAGFVSHLVHGSTASLRVVDGQVILSYLMICFTDMHAKNWFLISGLVQMISWREGQPTQSSICQ
jgi:hypothetical protein